MTKFLIRLLFFILVAGNLSLSIPPPSGSLLWIDSFLAFNNQHIKPNFYPLIERIGLHNRWNMFTHAPTEKEHGWYNMFYRTQVTSKDGETETYYAPSKTKLPLYERYTQYRMVKFRDSFWMLKSSYLNSFRNFHAKEFLLRHPNSQFPLQVKIVAEYEKIQPPGWINVTPQKYDYPFDDRSLAKEQLFCGNEGTR